MQVGSLRAIRSHSLHKIWVYMPPIQKSAEVCIGKGLQFFFALETEFMYDVIEKGFVREAKNMFCSRE